MTARDKPTLKSYFNTGDVPSESNYADLIDSIPDAFDTSGYDQNRILVLHEDLRPVSSYVPTIEGLSTAFGVHTANDLYIIPEVILTGDVTVPEQCVVIGRNRFKSGFIGSWSLSNDSNVAHMNAKSETSDPCFVGPGVGERADVYDCHTTAIDSVNPRCATTPGGLGSLYFHYCTIRATQGEEDVKPFYNMPVYETEEHAFNNLFPDPIGQDEQSPGTNNSAYTFVAHGYASMPSWGAGSDGSIPWSDGWFRTSDSSRADPHQVFQAGTRVYYSVWDDNGGTELSDMFVKLCAEDNSTLYEERVHYTGNGVWNYFVAPVEFQRAGWNASGKGYGPWPGAVYFGCPYAILPISLGNSADVYVYGCQMTVLDGIPELGDRAVTNVVDYFNRHTNETAMLRHLPLPTGLEVDHDRPVVLSEDGSEWVISPLTVRYPIVSYNFPADLMGWEENHDFKHTADLWASDPSHGVLSWDDTEGHDALGCIRLAYYGVSFAPEGELGVRLKMNGAMVKTGDKISVWWKHQDPYQSPKFIIRFSYKDSTYSETFIHPEASFDWTESTFVVPIEDNQKLLDAVELTTWLEALDPYYEMNTWIDNVTIIGPTPLPTSAGGGTGDVIQTGSITAGHLAVWASDHHIEDGGAPGESGTVAAFTDLTDVPNSYTGLGGQYLKVKSTEDGLETGTPSGSGGSSSGDGNERITEDLSSQVDGINVDFLTTEIFVPNSTLVTINGLRQAKDVHYTEHSSDKKITFSDAPLNVGFTDVVIIDYTLL